MSIEEKLEEQARKLGGGWRVEKGLMPIICLTTDEAQRVIDRLEEKKPHDDPDLLGVKFEDKHGVHFLSPEDVTFIYRSDGV